jgi:hypothetical protein
MYPERGASSPAGFLYNRSRDLAVSQGYAFHMRLLPPDAPVLPMHSARVVAAICAADKVANAVVSVSDRLLSHPRRLLTCVFVEYTVCLSVLIRCDENEEFRCCFPACA